MAAQLPTNDLNSSRLVSCHMSNGCSLAAIRHGRSIDTTVGFTTLDGLMMGSLSGSVDPGILPYLLGENKIRGEGLDDLLHKKSGLLGISGLSIDMREALTVMGSGNARAKPALYLMQAPAAKEAGCLDTEIVWPKIRVHRSGRQNQLERSGCN